MSTTGPKQKSNFAMNHSFQMVEKRKTLAAFVKSLVSVFVSLQDQPNLGQMEYLFSEFG